MPVKRLRGYAEARAAGVPGYLTFMSPTASAAAAAKKIPNSAICEAIQENRDIG